MSFVLLLDNFESNLDEASRKIIDPEVSGFYQFLLARLLGKSRAIITSRYLPTDAALPSRAMEWQLGEFSEAAFIKFMLRNSIVERRYLDGELSHNLLIQLHSILGGTPRFLRQIRKLLETMSAVDLRTELDKVSLPTTRESDRSGTLQTVRDAYCESIFTARLYASLPSSAQKMLRRTAVMGFAIPLDGLAAIGGLTEREAELAAEAASEVALLHRVPGAKALWSVYGILRGWLLAQQRTSAKERRAAHQAAGDYLRRVDQDDRENELGIGFIACRLEARAQYMSAGNWEMAKAITSNMSSQFIRSGFYQEIYRLNMELLKHKEHSEPLAWIGAQFLAQGKCPEARSSYIKALGLNDSEGALKGKGRILHQLATIDLYEKDYISARKTLGLSLEVKLQAGDESGVAAAWHQLATVDVFERDFQSARLKSEKALELMQRSDDRDDEGAIWHQLASIDIEEGKYHEAREKLGKALGLERRINDIAGEAATWYQMGAIAMGTNNPELGLRLAVLSWIIDASISHRDTEQDFSAVTALAKELGYFPALLQAIAQKVSDDYKADRGISLLQELDGALELSS